MKGNRPTMGKLNPRAVKCIFVGYSSAQKGYVCWSPIERRLFVSMNVTFRESKPYYTLKVISSFDDSSNTSSMRREGESSADERLVHVEMIPYFISIDQMMPLRQSVEEPRQLAEELVQSTEVPIQSAEMPG
jgi:hypothetical protein